MAFFDGVPCPVCGKPFTQEDDVVVCPDCGTPHHRDCWALEQHCANQDRHGGEFQFERPAAVKLPETPAAVANGAPDGTSANGSGVTCPGCGHVYDNTYTFCPQCGLRRQQLAPQPPLPMAQPPIFAPPPSLFAGQEHLKIDGETVPDVAQAVVQNVQRYIPVFLKKNEGRHKAGWNWCAFFFGGYWFLSRKCYGAGLVAILLQLAVSLPFNVFIQRMPGFDKIYESLMNPQNLLTPSSEILAFVSKVTPYYIAMIAISLVLRVLFGLFSDEIYKRKILKVVREERASYETAKLSSPVAITYGNVQLSPHDVYYAMLARRGGTNLFAIVGGWAFNQLLGTALLTLLLA